MYVALFTEKVQDFRTLMFGRKSKFFFVLFHVLARYKIIRLEFRDFDLLQLFLYAKSDFLCEPSA